MERPRHSSADCPECGFAGLAPSSAAAAARLRSLIAPWRAVLSRSGIRERPAPETWSPIEYGFHVRDLCVLAPARLSMMVAFDNPAFDNWDQNHAALERNYRLQDPLRLKKELTAWIEASASVLDAVPEDRQARCGRRSDGMNFTITTFIGNLLHEVEHHLQDAGGN